MNPDVAKYEQVARELALLAAPHLVCPALDRAERFPGCVLDFMDPEGPDSAGVFRMKLQSGYVVLVDSTNRYRSFKFSIKKSIERLVREIRTRFLDAQLSCWLASHADRVAKRQATVRSRAFRQEIALMLGRDLALNPLDPDRTSFRCFVGSCVIDVDHSDGGEVTLRLAHLPPEIAQQIAQLIRSTLGENPCSTMSTWTE